MLFWSTLNSPGTSFGNNACRWAARVRDSFRFPRMRFIGGFTIDSNACVTSVGASTVPAILKVSRVMVSNIVPCVLARNSLTVFLTFQ